MDRESLRGDEAEDGEDERGDGRRATFEVWEFTELEAVAVEETAQMAVET